MRDTITIIIRWCNCVPTGFDICDYQCWTIASYVLCMECGCFWLTVSKLIMHALGNVITNILIDSHSFNKCVVCVRSKVQASICVGSFRIRRQRPARDSPQMCQSISAKVQSVMDQYASMSTYAQAVSKERHNKPQNFGRSQIEFDCSLIHGLVTSRINLHASQQEKVASHIRKGLDCVSIATLAWRFNER